VSAIRSNHGRVFDQLVIEWRRRLVNAIVEGTDRKNYWRLIGQIQGLDDALRLSNEADFKLSGDEPNAGA